MRKTCILHVFLLVVAASGCKYLRKDPGRVLVRTTSNRLEAHALSGKSDDVFTGAADALPYPNGAGALVIDTTGVVSRVEPGRSNVSCPLPENASLLAIDDSGDHALLKVKDATGKSESVELTDLTTCDSTKLAVRYAYRGDVARDGKEAVVGAFPTSCTDSDMNKCPVTLYRLRMPGSPVPTEVLRGGPRAHYQPRYFPNGQIVFQTTERDATCDGTIDHCRHDIVAMPSAGGPGSTLEVIREGAIAAGVSNDGKRIAYLSYWKEAGCHGVLPCKSMTLKVGDVGTHDDSKDVSIATGTVSNVPGHPFSLDGKWIAFSTGSSFEPRVCRIDGTDCKTYSGHTVGWMK
jgi:hypothetical protein